MRSVRISRHGLCTGLVVLSLWTAGLMWFWYLWKDCSAILATKKCDGASNLNGTRQRITPVYVVEEHHEVLFYWYDAVEKGLIKLQNNVLLHIDGHSDGATPSLRDILPWFRLPTKTEVYNMMQQNDDFIVAAVITGLINRVIWVWPPWATNRTDDHIVGHFNLGTTMRKDLVGNMLEDVCACVHTDEDVGFPQGCMVKTMDPESEVEAIFIHPEDCKIVIHDALFEVVTENKAIELMKTGNWITSLDGLILDIDEDYYGCEAAVQPLYDVDITENKLQLIQLVVGKTFCPAQPGQELHADIFYSRIIDQILNFKMFCSRRPNSVEFCKNEEKMSNYAKSLTENFFKDAMNSEMYSTLCDSDQILKKALNILTSNFLKLTHNQLKALKEVGICLFMSPRTFVYSREELVMRTCDGFNRPNDSAVIFHTPTRDEVAFRTRQLKVMLSSGDLQPGVITLCRSMRDGYTPRKLFHVIEEDVLNVLKDTFVSVDDASIFYDPYLLGGSLGWPNRH